MHITEPPTEAAAAHALLRAEDRAPSHSARPRRSRWGSRLAVAWWIGVAALALGVILGGADLPIADHDPAARGALIGYVPRGAVQAAVAVLGGGLAVAGAWMLRARHLAAAGRVAAARTGRAGLLAAAWTMPAALALAMLDTRLLALAGYLPLLLVLAPFDAEFRAALVQALEPGYLLQLLTVAGLVLWAGAVIGYQRATAVPGPVRRWATPAAAAHWGRTAAIVAAVIPFLYALTRFTWLVYPLGFDREVWESARADGSLLAGVWLGAFATVGAVLTLGLTMRWGEVFPRWIPRLAGRPVPVRLAVVPASLVAMVVLPAGNSMILHVLSQEHGPAEPAGNWGAVGPTFLWPLWGVALGAAAFAYYLRRRPSEASSGAGARPTRPAVRSATATR